MGIHPAGPDHETLYQELLAVLRRANLSNVELLAIASNMVGKILAMQDQRRYTPETAMEIVIKNIEEGNRQAIAALVGTPAGHT